MGQPMDFVFVYSIALDLRIFLMVCFGRKCQLGAADYRTKGISVFLSKIEVNC